MGTGSFLGGLVLGTVSTAALGVWFYQTQLVKKKKIKTKIFDDGDVDSTSSSFLTNIIRELWPNIRVVVQDLIRDMLIPMLESNSMELKSFDLGRSPIRMDNVVVQKRKADVVQFELDLIWDAQNVNIDISSMVGSFGVAGIRFAGHMQVILKPLKNSGSIVQAVQYTFINTPALELEFSGLASAVSEINAMEEKVRSLLADTLDSMVVLPLRMNYKLDDAASLFDMYEPPLGLLRLTILSGRGFQVEMKMIGRHDVPDVYVQCKVGTSPIYRTPTIKNNLSPVWWDDNTNRSQACSDFLLSDYHQMVYLKAWDEDSGTLDPDDYLGEVAISVRELLLLQGGSNSSTELELLMDGKSTGAFLTVHGTVCPFTTDLPEESLPSSLAARSSSCKCGLVSLIVTRGVNLPIEKASSEKKPNSVFVEIQNVGPKPLQTGAVDDSPGYDSSNPVFDTVFDVPLAGQKEPIQIILFNNETVVASTTISLETLREAASSGQKKLTAQKLIVGGGWIEYGILLQGIVEPTNAPARPKTPAAAAVVTTTADAPQKNIRGAMATTPTSTTSVARELPDSPSAVASHKKVRITLVNGHGFKIQKYKLKKDDIPDVFCRIAFLGKRDWTTSTIKDSCDPVWNESRDFLLTTTASDYSGHYVVLDVYEQDKKRDEELGRARVTVGELLLASPKPVEIEIEHKGHGTRAFLLLRAELV